MVKTNSNTAAAAAAEVAREAAIVAKEVSDKAAETANRVVELSTKTSEAVLLFGKDLSYIRDEIIEIKARLDQKYVTQDRYMFTEKIVWGLVVSMIGAFITIFIKR